MDSSSPIGKCEDGMDIELPGKEENASRQGCFEAKND